MFWDLLNIPETIEMLISMDLYWIKAHETNVTILLCIYGC